MAERTLYEILMVDAGADAGIITLVYHALAKRYHPDRTDLPDGPRRMAQLNAAYAVLSDPGRREQYDLSIGLSPRHRPVRARVAIPIDPDVHAHTAGPTSVALEAEFGDAGAPPPYPPPAGSVLGFGRYRGWTLNQVDAYDPNHIDWLQRTPTGRTYRAEIEAILRRRVSA